MLKIQITTAEAVIQETELITAGRRGLECAFSFDSAWADLAKTVVVQGVVKRDIQLVGNSIVVPGECIAKENYPLKIGVYGANGDGDIAIPTVWASFGKILPSATRSDIPPDELTPDLVSQIEQNSANAIYLAQRVSQQAANGEFNGANGLDGADGYSPTIDIESIAGGHRVTTHDIAQVQSFDVMNGLDGIDGEGVPTGGTTGQYLRKFSGMDYDTEWATMPEEVFWAVRGTTTSAQIEAAYQAGKVVCCSYNKRVYRLSNRESATDHYFTCIGGNSSYSLRCNNDSWGTATVFNLALTGSVPSAATSAPADLGTAAVGSSFKYAKADHVHKMPSASDVGAYALPANGIPKTDLASAVQTSLDKADTALQSAPVTSVNGSTGAVTISVPSASSATPKALGTAAAGSSTDYSRADHVHAKPTASDIGAVSQAEFDLLDGEVTDLKSATNQVTSKDIFWIRGALRENGSRNSINVNRIINDGVLPFSLGGEISCSSSYKFRVGYYNYPELIADSPSVPDGYFVKFSDWITDGSYIVESGYYICILAIKSDLSEISDPIEISEHLNISLHVNAEYTNYIIEHNASDLDHGVISYGHGGIVPNNARVRTVNFIDRAVDFVVCANPYKIRLFAWKDNEFKGIWCGLQNGWSKDYSLHVEQQSFDLRPIKSAYPDYRIKLYYGNPNSSPPDISIVESALNFIYDKYKKLEGNGDKFSGKIFAIIGDSISTNGNSGIDANVPEITITAQDVGVQLSAYLTYYDVQAGLSLGGHTYTSSEIGTEVSFTPTSEDVGKSIGLPSNYNENSVVTWWEVLQEKLGVKCIPNTWSGASITSHRGTITQTCSYAWHESQIRKCGIRVPGSMTRIAPDVIIIYRGTNDFSLEPYTLLTNGYFDSANWQYPETDVVDGGYGFKQGMCITIKKLRDAYPNAKIFLCTLNVFKRINYSHFPTNNGINTLPQYNNAIREVANYMGCGVIEFDKDGITFENCYSQGYITDSATNPTHPNNKGHRVMGLKAIADLQAQFSELE